MKLVLKQFALCMSMVSAEIVEAITCPSLVCTNDESTNILFETNTLLQDKCYNMASDVNQKVLHAKDCYGDERQKDKKLFPRFCPFNLQSGDFAWVDEKLQNVDKGKYLTI